MSFLSQLFGRFFPADPLLEPDLIDHPVFQGMSLRDLADLPFPRPTPRGEDEDAVGAGVMQPSEPHEIRPAA